MDMSLLPDDIKFANKNQQNYIEKAGIVEICRKYASYERMRKQSDMKHVIKCLQGILDKLAESGHVTRSHNFNTDWTHYHANTPQVIEMYQRQQKENQQELQKKAKSSVEVKVDSKVNLIADANKQYHIDPMKFDVNDYTLTGINLTCAIAEKYRNLAFSARSRGLKFNLTLEDVESIILAKHCYYSNVEFDGVTHIKTVDRIDNTKGYISGNVVACTYEINQFKNDILESKQNRLFKNVVDLKRFVDILFVTQSKSANPLSELLDIDRLNTEKKG